MNVEELKVRLRALLHQRDMPAYEHASLELFDLIEEKTVLSVLQMKYPACCTTRRRQRAS